jgi:ParB/RepB/Spo0J family partition protein
MSARSEVIGHKAGEFFTKGVMRMMTVAMPGREEPTEVEIIEKIPVGDIDPNPLNRTEFDEGKLAEMVESLREHGQTTAAIVRPKADGRLELVAGERRLRGCKLAGIATLDCVVRSYSDTQAAEILLIENLEREDLKPSEEARIYQRLLELKDEGGANLYTLEKIAARVHNDARKVDRVARVLTILNLPPAVKKALDEDKVSLLAAYMVARIADPEDRKTAGEMVLKGLHGEGVMTKQQAADYIARTFQVNLKGAKFDREDPDILSEEQKEALGYTGAFGQANDGSCERCPWLAKNHPVYKQELAVGGSGKQGKKVSVGIDPLTCTRAKCHEAKLEAVWQREAAVFAKKHEAVRVLTRRESEALRNWNSEWVELEEKPSHNDTGNWEHAQAAPTWAKLIKGAGVPLVVARDIDAPGGAEVPILVAERSLAIEAARKARPDLFAEAKVVGQSAAKVVLSEEEVEAQKKLEFERKVKAGVDARLKRVVLEELLESIGSGGLALEGYRGLFDSISRNVDHMGLLATWVLPSHTDEDEWPETAMNAYLDGVNADGVLALCAVASVVDDVMYSGPDRAEDFQTLAKAQGMDIKAIRKRVEKEVKRKLEAEVKAAEAGEKEKVQRENRNAMEDIQKRSILEGEKDAGESVVEIPAEPGEWVYGHELLEQLKPHLGGQHVEGRDWLSVLAGMAVRKSKPNEHGVYLDTRSPEPLKWKGAKKKDGVNLELALDEETGIWHVGYSYQMGDRSGGGGPSDTVGGFPTREQAIECGLRILCDVVKVAAVFNVLDELREVLMDACPVLSAGRTVDEAAEADGLTQSHEGTKEVAEATAEEVPETGKREAMPEAEKVAWESYLETGSITEAAKAAGVAVDTVKNWHKRRKWKALRLATVGG